MFIFCIHFLFNNFIIVKRLQTYVTFSKIRRYFVQMGDQDPTSVINMIKDLRSGAKSYSRSSGVSVRFSGTSCISSVFNENDESIVSPKRQKLDESDMSVIDKSQSDSVPGSPWEWRRLKGEVISQIIRLYRLILQLLLLGNYHYYI